MITTRIVFVLFLVSFAACVVPSVARAQSASESAVELNEGVRLFLLGRQDQQLDTTTLEEAVAQFDQVIAAQPDSKAAYLFRALAFGEMAALYREKKLGPEDVLRSIDLAIEMLQEPAKRAALEENLAAVQRRLTSESLPELEREVLERKKNGLERQLDILNNKYPNRTVAELRDDRTLQIRELQQYSDNERQACSEMVDSISRLYELLDDPQAVVALLDVVAGTKIARIHEDEALRIIEGDVPAAQRNSSSKALRDESKRILERLAGVLEETLSGAALDDENRARATYFLGVVRYRLAVPRSVPEKEAWRAPDLEQLSASEEAMRRLVADDSAPDAWRSYAALYLGLILPVKAQQAGDEEERSALFDEAEKWLRDAVDRDLQPQVNEVTGESELVSASGDQILDLVWQQRDQITEARTATPVTREPLNDIRLTFHMGAHRDTNVVLLGERTDLPRDISDPEDFGFRTGMIIDYTRDLDDRWTLGFQGRVSSLWHADIDTFDEQQYGGSLALQYALIQQREDGFGPVHLRLQYDYNYTLLGRDGFLSSNVITPNIEIYWNERQAWSRLWFAYEIRNYFEPLFDKRFNRDGDYLAIGASHGWNAVDMTAVYNDAGVEAWGHANDQSFEQDREDGLKRFLKPYVALQYAWDQTDGQEFDRKAVRFDVGAVVPLPYGIDLEADMGFEWEDYDGGSLVDYHRRGRRDMIQRYGLAVARTFVLQPGVRVNRYRPEMDRVLMTLRAFANWTHDDSNVQDRLGQSIYEYDRVVYGLSVAFTFN